MLLIPGTIGIMIPEPWMTKVVQSKCDKLKVPWNKLQHIYIDYRNLVVHPDSLICKPLMVMFHYLTENYKFILPETIIYLRTMFQVYIREDSFTGSRKSGNFNVICDTCCNEINGADLLDRNRTKLKKYLGELKVIYVDLQLESFSNRQKSSFYSEHYNKAVSAMHECKIHCLIVKSSGAKKTTQFISHGKNN